MNNWHKLLTGTVKPIALLFVGFMGGLGVFWMLFSVVLHPLEQDSFDRNYMILERNFRDQLASKDMTISNLGADIADDLRSSLELENKIAVLRDSIIELKSLGMYLGSFHLKSHENVWILGGYLGIAFNRDKSGDYFSIDIILDTCLYYNPIISSGCKVHVNGLEIDEGSLVPLRILDDNYLLYFREVGIPPKKVKVELYRRE